MPIRPEQRILYGADWRAFALSLKQAAGWRCACTGECGADHTQLAKHPDRGPGTQARCEARHGEPHPLTGSRVVLTVAHLNHRPQERDPGTVLVTCQLPRRRTPRPDPGGHPCGS